MEDVTVKATIGKYSTKTDSSGTYTITLPATKLSLVFSKIGYRTQTVAVDLLHQSNANINVALTSRSTNLDEVKVKDKSVAASNAISIDPSLLQSLPSVSGSFESILKTLPGVSTNNELSSQYSVRGGNFDENLVYVNDIEIYRPVLVRNGQQEGLSFINPEMAGNVHFSAGGFAAKYGDKLSSVLDVKYFKPDSNAATVTAGLMGLSATIKAINKAKTNFIVFGARQKTNQSILNTQDVKGDYQARFYDFQVHGNYSPVSKLDISVLAGLNTSRFTLTPQDRETEFGTVNEVLRLQVDYEGKEQDSYRSLLGGLNFSYRPNSSHTIRWINSFIGIKDNENFDIEGAYIFDEVVPGLPGSEVTVRANRGIGSDINHARNQLRAGIFTSELRSTLQKEKSLISAGLKFRFDDVEDNLDEYRLTDSAGYTLPYQPNFVLTDVSKAQNRVQTYRFSGFIQNDLTLSSTMSLTGGIRAYYDSYAGELLLSPRGTLLLQPVSKDYLYRFSVGSYNQPNFYRELRNFNGSLNSSARAQKSLHFLAGTDRSFSGLGTNLKFSGEVYYKHLSRLTPYEIDNLRIRYYADREAKGYASGIDLSISGAFVRELESSFRLSLMQTKEDIEGDSRGYLKRPTDQRLNLSVFFQDRLMNSPTYKVHLNLLYGSALPTSPPRSELYRSDFKIPAYRRVDIGFSKDFLDTGRNIKQKFFSRYFNNLILYAEVFNLLDIDNTVSYLWIKDVNNNQFAIPNKLTGRQINLKLISKLKL